MVSTPAAAERFPLSYGRDTILFYKVIRSNVLCARHSPIIPAPNHSTHMKNSEKHHSKTPANLL